MPSSATYKAASLRSHLIPGYCSLYLDGLVVESLHRAATEHSLHRLLSAEGDEPKASRSLIVVIIHDHRILHLWGRRAQHEAAEVRWHKKVGFSDVNGIMMLDGHGSS